MLARRRSVRREKMQLLKEFEVCLSAAVLRLLLTARKLSICLSCRSVGIYIEFPSLSSFLLHLAAKRDAPEGEKNRCA